MGDGWKGEVRYLLAMSIARRDSSRSEPVTMNFIQPMLRARSMMSSMSLSWTCLP
jgi:hypothetical protein